MSYYKQHKHSPGALSSQSRQSQQTPLVAAWVTEQLKLAAVCGYSGDMLPPLGLECELDRGPILAQITLFWDIWKHDNVNIPSCFDLKRKWQYTVKKKVAMN